MHIDNPFKWKTIVIGGEKMHEGVSGLIQRDGQYLLVLRRFPPFGYGLVAGHLDVGETEQEGLAREIFEEIGAQASDFRFLFSIADAKPTHFFRHYSHIYACEIDREPRINYESKSYGWFAPEQLANLKLTHTTKEIFRKLGVLK